MNSCFPLLSYLVFSRQILASVCVLAWSRTGGQNRRGGGHFLSICDIFCPIIFTKLLTYCFPYVIFGYPISHNLHYVNYASRVRVCATPSPRVATCSKGQRESKRTLGEVYLALPVYGLQQGGNEDLTEVITYQYTTSSQPSKIIRRPSAIDKRSPGS